MNGQIHSVPTERVFALLRSRPGGLRSDEVAERQRELGLNTLRAERRFRRVRTLLKQFTNFFSILLDISAALCFVADGMQPGEGMALLGWALLGVSLLNALFSFIQENRAERAMEELRKLLPRRVTVLRDGRETEVDAEQVVPGDVCSISEGARVPADARIVEARDLLVNNAPLTGESKPVSLSEQPSSGRLVDSPNVLFAGCSVLRGTGKAVVFAIGRRTEFGRIAALSEEVRRPPSPLERQTQRMVRILTIIAVAMGVTFFAYGVISGRSLWVNLVFMLGIIVANVPEGLLPTFTLALGVGATRLARKKVLVKSLNAVEALGSVQVICTDKTGTLTLNQLSVTRVVDAASGRDIEGDARMRLLHGALVASDVHLKDGSFSGDPLDVAIACVYSESAGDVGMIRESVRRHFAFDVAKRRAAGTSVAASGGSFCVKGAWEALRPMVSDIASAHSSDDLPSRQRRVTRTVERLAEQGYRVIAVAAREVETSEIDEQQADLERGLTLLGLLCLEDPLRPEVPGAVDKCVQAGIRVLIVTGDHPKTAQAIAQRAHILPESVAEGSDEVVLTGDRLEGMRQRDLDRAIAAGVTVFARTTPEQKLKIVSAFERLGFVVAMTGDGVNDAPALKAADVGVAMGLRGTDVAREAAQVVLLDDNFASIVAGIEEGRTIFDNIRKFTNYVLVSNGPEILPYLLYILLPVPLALTVIQILCIDLGTDIVPSMALGQEPTDPETMKRPPRPRDEPLLSFPLVAHSYFFLGLIEAGYSLLLFFLVLNDGGWTWGQDLSPTDPLYRSATAITLSTIMLMQIGNLIGRRSTNKSGLDSGLWKNPLMVLGVVLEIGFSYAVLYVEPVSRVLGTGPVPWQYYALGWFGPILIFTADYLRKRVGLRFAASRSVAPRSTGVYSGSV